VEAAVGVEAVALLPRVRPRQSEPTRCPLVVGGDVTAAHLSPHGLMALSQLTRGRFLWLGAVSRTAAVSARLQAGGRNEPLCGCSCLAGRQRTSCLVDVDAGGMSRPRLSSWTSCRVKLRAASRRRPRGTPDHMWSQSVRCSLALPWISAWRGVSDRGRGGLGSPCWSIYIRRSRQRVLYRGAGES